MEGILIIVLGSGFALGFFLAHEMCQEFLYDQAAAAGLIPPVDIHGSVGPSDGDDRNLTMLVLVGVLCPLAVSLALGWGLLYSLRGGEVS